MDDYAKYRRNGRAITGDLDFATDTTTTTLVEAKSAEHTIFIQKIIVIIKTSAAQTITFEDNAAAPTYLAKITSSPAADSRWEFDFGPRGKDLAVGKNFVATFSAAGLAGHINYVGYQRVV